MSEPTAERPHLTDAMLHSWEEYALADEAACKSFMAPPGALLGLIAEIRAARTNVPPFTSASDLRPGLQAARDLIAGIHGFTNLSFKIAALAALDERIAELAAQLGGRSPDRQEGEAMSDLRSDEEIVAEALSVCTCPPKVIYDGPDEDCASHGLHEGQGRAVVAALRSAGRLWENGTMSEPTAVERDDCG